MGSLCFGNHGPTMIAGSFQKLYSRNDEDLSCKWNTSMTMYKQEVFDTWMHPTQMTLAHTNASTPSTPSNSNAQTMGRAPEQ
jgi:hypothetical protein